MRTIQCRLNASRETREFLWKAMVESTRLINQLFHVIAEHEHFQQWQKKGLVPEKKIRGIIQSIKSKNQLSCLPSLFYGSTNLITQYVYKSWFALQESIRRRLEGKRKWLETVQQDDNLVQQHNLNSELIFQKAKEIIQKYNLTCRYSLDADSCQTSKMLDFLFDEFAKTKNVLKKRAIIHLLRNRFIVNEKEDTNYVKFILERKRIEIESLEAQLKSQLPQGRDPIGERFNSSLMEATCLLPDNGDNTLEPVFTHQRQNQIKALKPIPYPLVIGSAGKLRWFSQEQNKSKKKSSATRICFKISGLQKHFFKVQCDRRQLPMLFQFMNDYRSCKALPKGNRFSESLFALRSAQLIWRKHNSKQSKRKQKNRTLAEPWDAHCLYLQCNFDPQRLTLEGTRKYIEESKQKIMNRLGEHASLNSRQIEELNVSESQKTDIKRKHSTLFKLLHSPVPVRSAQTSCYRGNPLIRIGISLRCQKPVAVCSVNIKTNHLIESKTTKQLLYIQDPKDKGKRRSLLQLKNAHWRLIGKLHIYQRRYFISRSKEQKQNLYRRSNKEVNLAKYVERLLANRIVSFAIEQKAGSIAVPDLKFIREVIDSYIKAEAKARFPNKKELQKRYRKNFRARYHRWSYHRFINYIGQRAAKFGISIVIGQQSRNYSLLQNALNVALSGH